MIENRTDSCSYPRLVQRHMATMYSVVPISRAILSDIVRLRRHAAQLAAQLQREVRIELASTRHEYVTPGGEWHTVHLWRDIAQRSLSGQVVALDWYAGLVTVKSNHGPLVLDIRAFEADGEDNLYIGAPVDILWTMHEEVSGIVIEKHDS